MNEPADTGAVAAGGGAADGEFTALAETAPPAVDDDDDVIDAEIVESPVLAPSAYGTLPSPDYSESGVPSLDYVRDKIEGRYATAIGGSELARAAADREAAAKAAAQQRQALTAEEQRVARERAAKDKLEEIRRSLRP
jgi:hypothetical protein